MPQSGPGSVLYGLGALHLGQHPQAPSILLGTSLLLIEQVMSSGVFIPPLPIPSMGTLGGTEAENPAERLGDTLSPATQHFPFPHHVPATIVPPALV